MTRNGHTFFSQSEETAFSDHARTAISHEDSGERIARIAARFDLPEERAMDLVAEVLEEFATEPVGKADTERLMRMIKRGMRAIVASSGNARELSHKFYYFLLAMRWFDLLDGIQTSTELAKRLHLTKANANKFVNAFRDTIGDSKEPLPASGSQRKEDARSLFAQTRRTQESKRLPEPAI